MSPEFWVTFWLSVTGILVPSAVALYAAITSRTSARTVREFQQWQSQVQVLQTESIRGLRVENAVIHSRQLAEDDLSPVLPMVMGPEGNTDCFYAIVALRPSGNWETIPLYATVSGNKRLRELMEDSSKKALGIVQRKGEEHHVLHILTPYDPGAHGNKEDQ